MQSSVCQEELQASKLSLHKVPTLGLPKCRRDQDFRKIIFQHFLGVVSGIVSPAVLLSQCMQCEPCAWMLHFPIYLAYSLKL